MGFELTTGQSLFLHANQTSTQTDGLMHFASANTFAETRKRSDATAPTDDVTIGQADKVRKSADKTSCYKVKEEDNRMTSQHRKTRGRRTLSAGGGERRSERSSEAEEEQMK